MGNVEMHDLAPVRDDERKELDISRKVNYKQYCKHMKDENAEACLMEIPWNIRDSVSLYERMNASFNCLEELPVELPLRLPHLSHLNLSYNRLTAIPESFGLFFHLKTVLLHNNRLKELPASFTHLVKLEKLDLSHNAIRVLPEEVGSMEALTSLNVSHNKLKTLPMSLGLSKSIKVILATANRLITPPQALCNDGSEAVIKYLVKHCDVGVMPEVKPRGNVFPRIRGNQLHTSVPNPHSAQAQYIQAQTDTSNMPSRIKTPLMPPLEATALDTVELRDKIIGLLYGAAVGDAIGIATTYMTRDEVAFHYDLTSIMYTDIIRDEHRVRWRPGDWTSDTDQLLLMLESLLGWGGVVDELDFAKRLRVWYNTGFKELGDSEGYNTSNTIAKVVNNAAFETNPHEVAHELVGTRSESHRNSLYVDNGSICRSLLLGIPHFHDLQEVTSNAVRICRATHADPRCVAAGVIVATLGALMLQGTCDLSLPEVVEEVLEQAKAQGLKFITDSHYAEAVTAAMEHTTFESIMIGEVGHEDHVLVTLAVVAASLRMKHDYRTAVTMIMSHGGCSNTNAALAGALLGCRCGYSQLPQSWVGKLRKRQTDWLNAKINHLLDMMGIP